MQKYVVPPLFGAGAGLLAGSIYLQHNHAKAAQVLPALIPMPVNLHSEARVTFIEGALQDFDLAARILVVNGTQIQVPATLLIDTTGDGVGDITLAQLTNPALPTPIGGTIQATAKLQANQSGHAVFSADSLYFAFGERVVVGPLVAVDAAGGLFQVAGHQIHMSTDPRLSPRVTDLVGNPLTVADLVGFEGSLVSAEGYGDNGAYFAKFLETQALVPGTTVDGVGVFRALWDASKRQVNVRGTITAHPITGAFAPNVQVDLACDGVGIINATVVPEVGIAQGTWRWKSANNAVPNNPGTVCVRSVQGGNAQRATN